MADRIAIMDQGQIMQVGAPRQIYEFPNSKLTAEFIGSINLFEAVAVFDAGVEPGVDVAVGGESVPCRLECEELPCAVVCTESDRRFSGPCYVALRPEKINLETTLEPVSSNWVRGKIDDIAYLGSHNVLHVRIESPAGKAKIVQVHVSNFARHAKSLDFEQAVALSWAPEAVVLIKAEAP